MNENICLATYARCSYEFLKYKRTLVTFDLMTCFIRSIASGCRKRNENPILVCLRSWNTGRGHCRSPVTYWPCRVVLSSGLSNNVQKEMDIWNFFPRSNNIVYPKISWNQVLGKIVLLNFPLLLFWIVFLRICRKKFFAIESGSSKWSLYFWCMTVRAVKVHILEFYSVATTPKQKFRATIVLFCKIKNIKYCNLILVWSSYVCKV